MAMSEERRTEVRLEELLRKAIEEGIKLPSPVLVVEGSYRNSTSFPADITYEILKGEPEVVKLYPPNAGEDCDEYYDVTIIVIPRTSDDIVLIESYGHDWYERSIYAFDARTKKWKVLEY